MKKNNLYTFIFNFRVFIVIVFLLSANTIFAQPSKQYYGCKAAHHLHQHKAPVLSPQDQLNLAKSNERSDTIDIVHYNINLDFTAFAEATISGFTEISMVSKMNNVNSITLDLLQFNIDSIEAQGQLLTYTYDGDLLTVQLPTSLNVEETLDFSVHYSGQPTPASSGFGGLVFQDGIAYNLGIGLGATPYNYGRGWFPCFDTFVERSTFEMNIISNDNRRAYCIGTFMGETDLGNGAVMRSYELNQEIPTYLAGIAVGNFDSWQMTHTGAYGDVPLEILAKPSNLTQVVNNFHYLDESVDALENWWGQYPWERVGFVMTGNGAMEHPTNTAFRLSLALNGPFDVSNEVMIHELGHHWWGNVVTLNGPQNMWIKEGGAEYSSFLFYEYVFDKNEFQRVVKDNNILVLEEAHLNDDGYQALSPMPYDQTYGTHTYQKGALVFHNMRGYLGDSLYKVGTRSVLEEFAYSAISAEQFRDQLTLATGVDMNPFFDAWIFAPGYSTFELDDMTVTPQGNDFEITLDIQQKLLAAPAFHQAVPVSVSFVDDNYNFHHDQVMVSGENSSVTLTVPFEPTSIYMNGEHELNLAVIGAHKFISETGSAQMGYGGIGINVSAIQDSVFLRLDEYRVAPDPSPTNIYNARLSESRYFRVSGVEKDGFVARGSITVNGQNPWNIDYDLISETEDSLVVLYRANPTDDWEEYADYEVNTIGSSSNGLAIVYLEPLAMGEYTLANADIPPMVANENVLLEKTDWTIFPNPAAEQMSVSGKIKEDGTYNLMMFDLTGKDIFRKKLVVANGEFLSSFNVKNLPNGIYVVKITDEFGETLDSQNVEVLK